MRNWLGCDAGKDRMRIDNQLSFMFFNCPGIYAGIYYVKNRALAQTKKPNHEYYLAKSNYLL